MNPRLLLIASLVAALAWPGVAEAQRRPTPAAPARPRVSTDAVQRDSSGNVIFHREVYAYPRTGRRDPFSSLIQTGDVRPMVADLEIVAITVGQSERQAIATLRDKSANEVYRVRVGSTFGRLRVVAIRARDVVLAIDEFGYTRQETLSITVPAGGGRTP
ncbi:MAG: hypothetical protein KF689_01995 [Gemmatimonadaceae bacterium]|nr:hypothetical protein [Gemmatimonadaceae bacterium]MCW5826703.1 hypothetical protein [Gemmatimonadaceae bacterium]